MLRVWIRSSKLREAQRLQKWLTLSPARRLDLCAHVSANDGWFCRPCADLESLIEVNARRRSARSSTLYTGLLLDELTAISSNADSCVIFFWTHSEMFSTLARGESPPRNEEVPFLLFYSRAYPLLRKKPTWCKHTSRTKMFYMNCIPAIMRSFSFT